MHVTEKAEFLVVGFTLQASWKRLWKEMPEAWQLFFSRYQEIENRVNNRLIDLSLRKEKDVYTQLLCVEVSNADDPVPEGMIITTIPQKKYLHYKHTGSLEDIATSFGKMYNWGKEQNLTTTDFKLDIGYKPKNNERNHDLYIEITG
ncbi:MAG: effector binding domain-containing protein [Balneolaceae bacterium]